ncbi:hypothetical protein KSZ_68760 [Dictyobacter formicarum]|uniref:Uncharacterized protein n=1 Tax=Dictyobacter formicarum TaxID=2778368 RepID=A0ABQ3VRS2_9CHLR|nr:hypothetical protein KSZ_68760 [Dictyobacter formicarum]
MNKKTVAKYMQKMGLMAIFPGPNLSKRAHQAGIFPYLLRNLKAEVSDHIWGVDVRHVSANGIPVETGEDETNAAKSLLKPLQDIHEMLPNLKMLLN